MGFYYNLKNTRLRHNLACSADVSLASKCIVLLCEDSQSAEEGWGGISTKGVVNRRAFPYPPPPCPLLLKSNMTALKTMSSL